MREASRALAWPIAGIGGGAALVVLGCLVEIVEDQNAYTISQAISLPGLLAILLGFMFVAVGYSRSLRRTSGATRMRVFSVGVTIGTVACLGSIWWIVTYGVSATLEAYAATVIALGGAALVQVGCRLALTPKPTLPGRDLVRRSDSSRPPLFSSVRVRVAVAISLVTASAVLLGSLVLYIGWLNNLVITVNPAYQILVIAVMGPAAWWLATGVSGLVDTLPLRLALNVGFAGILAGVVFVLWGTAWWSRWALYPEFGVLLSTMLVITGLGLAAFSGLSLRRARVRGSDVA